MFTHVTAVGGVTMLSSCAELMSMELQQKPRLWRRVLLHDKSVTSMESLSEYGRGPLRISQGVWFGCQFLRRF